jgi:CHASE2 domain-containing sensor protein
VAGLKRFSKIALAVAVLVPVSGLRETVDLFHRLEPAFLNSDLGAHNLFSETRIHRVIVAREDYRSVFQGRLTPAGMCNSIDAIASRDPAVIVVDFDLSGSEFAAVRAHTAKMPVVWNRDSVHSSVFRQYWPSRSFGESGQVTENEGLAALSPDDDGVFRRYSRCLASNRAGPAVLGCPCPDVPSISLAALHGAKNSALIIPTLSPTHDPLLIRFSPNTDPSGETSLSKLVPPGAAPKNACQKEPPADHKSDKEITGKIVLFGGKYDPSDEHLTPLGEMFGIDIIAEIVATELDGGGQSPVSPLALVTLALASAVLLWLATARLASRPMKVIIPAGTLIVVLFASLSSLLLTRSFRLVGPLIVVLLAVLGYRVWDDFKRKREERQKTAGLGSVS